MSFIEMMTKVDWQMTILKMMKSAKKTNPEFSKNVNLSNLKIKTKR